MDGLSSVRFLCMILLVFAFRKGVEISSEPRSHGGTEIAKTTGGTIDESKTSEPKDAAERIEPKNHGPVH